MYNGFVEVVEQYAMMLEFDNVLDHLFRSLKAQHPLGHRNEPGYLQWDSA